MLYPKSKSPQLELALFQNPTSEYRGAPFWAWNCKLTSAAVQKQIGYFKEMGFGGFHIHARTGLATPYLGDEFMNLVKECVGRAEKEDMLVWLYDEDRYPSGAAGGLVTRNPKYRQRYLKLTVTPEADSAGPQAAAETGKPCLLGCFDVILDEIGALSAYDRMAEHGTARGRKWYAYVCTAASEPWFNGAAYLDALNPEAVRRFLALTYERYRNTVGDRFGKCIPAIFTDEPQLVRKQPLRFPQDTGDAVLPWTCDLPESYYAQYHENLISHIPELVWDLPDGQISRGRYRYHDHVAARFAQAFMGQCGAWCGENGLCYTGHMMMEGELGTQFLFGGEVMRAYSAFQLPGIDMLCDYVELTTAKQAQSAVRQYGREGMLSELYGVTNWDFDFRGHKFQGDWQAALGVTVRVPHLAWASMAGEAKRDYPASIHFQSPWYREYPYIEDHFARLNTVLTRGKAVVRVGVIHPMESYWLHWGPARAADALLERLESRFQNLTRWLCMSCADFDFICEAQLPELCGQGTAPLRVGEMAYDVIIVPACETLRRTTVERLEAFRRQGGKLIFLGEAPRYMDAVESAEPRALYTRGTALPFEETAVLEALEPYCYLKLEHPDGSRVGNFVHQLRADNGCKWLFLARGVKAGPPDLSQPQTLKITIHERCIPTVYDTLKGGTCPMACAYEGDDTILYAELYASDSLLLCLEPGTQEAADIRTEAEPRILFQKQIWGRVDYEREEPNVVLLDLAEYALDGEPFQEQEELLRLDDICRRRLGYTERRGWYEQPWTLKPEPAEHTLALRFRFCAACEFRNIRLALEQAAAAEIVLNGAAVPNEITGWYVDEAIKTLNLPPVRLGENVLTVTIPFGKSTNVEAHYLLGDFNVRLEGVEKTLVPASNKIGFSSITGQGMPFYGGNLVYSAEIEVPAGDLEIRLSRYRGALVRIRLDGTDCGVIAFDPFRLVIPGVEKGRHRIEMKLFGNRYNTFGALHETADWPIADPDLWRTKGERWCYEYRLRETGILSGPVIRVLEGKI